MKPHLEHKGTLEIFKKIIQAGLYAFRLLYYILRIEVFCYASAQISQTEQRVLGIRSVFGLAFFIFGLLSIQ